MSTTRFNRTGEGHRTLRAIMVACLLATSACAHAQAPAANTTASAAATPAQLDKLVAPIALYPDDLIAIILPGSTFPLQIVQADRYLDKRKSNAKLPVDETWDDSVKSLLNYPEVVKKMSTDLDWTSDLGEAVVADQSAVLEAVQTFRKQVQSAGNLKSDDKQTVVVEKEVIKIVPADPQVIYVPQYNPSTVVVYGGYSSTYYPAPYPVYYYPYPPGAAFATGLIWGAAISAAWNGGYNTNWGGGGNNNININRNTNINTGGNRVNGGDRVNAGNKGNAGGTPWKSTKSPGQVSGSTRGQGNSSRIGDSPGGRTGGAGAGASARPSTQPSARPSTGGPSGNQSMSRPSNTGGGASSRGGDALGSYGSGRDAQANSSRGASSRQSMSSPQRSGGGGAARSGGGARGGGGRGGRR